MRPLIKLISIAGVAFPLFAHSQQLIPMFEMPLYFEDVIGNKDTIVVGYDTLGSYDVLLPEFGEIEINTPFDSDFEVRTIHSNVINSDDKQMSKRNIAHIELWGAGASCGVSDDVVIIVQAKYPPVKVTYDSTLLWGHQCHTNTILSRDWDIHLFQYWWDAYHYECMGKTSSVELDFSPPLPIEGNVLMVRVPVNGQGMVEVPGFFMQFRGWGACTDSTLLIGTHQAPEKVQARIVPNPVEECAQVKFAQPQSGTLTVSNMQGQLLKNISLDNERAVNLLLESVAPGLYLVQLRTTSQGVWSGKLIIQ